MPFDEDRPYLSAMITDVNLEEEACSYARLLTKEIEDMDSSGDEIDDSQNNNSQNVNTSVDDLFKEVNFSDGNNREMIST